MNGYEEKIKDRLFLEVCNAAGREEWGGLAHQQKENLMLVCRLSGYDEKFQRDCGLVTREQMEHWGIEEGGLLDRKSTRLNSSHDRQSRMPSSA